MKVKDFLDNLNESFLEKIEEFSVLINSKREFKNYKNFEDIVYGQSLNEIKLKIKPIYKEIPNRFKQGKLI